MWGWRAPKLDYAVFENLIEVADCFIVAVVAVAELVFGFPWVKPQILFCLVGGEHNMYLTRGFTPYSMMQLQLFLLSHKKLF